MKRDSVYLYIAIAILIFALCYLSSYVAIVNSLSLLLYFIFYWYNSSKDFLQRIFWFFVFPISCMIIFILILNQYRFNYTPQIITVAGSITAALASIFVATSKEYNDKIKENKSRIILLKQINEMLLEATKVIDKEIINYQEFIDFIKTDHFSQKPLKTTPFIILEKVDLFDLKEVFKAITENFNPNISSKLYLRLTKDINKALFLKESVKNQYVTFINSYNDCASQWFKLQNNLNKVYRKNQSDIELKKISFLYNNANIIITDDVRKYLLNNLFDYYKQTPNINSANKIGKISREIESTMKKIDEIIEMIIDYFNDLIKDLNEVNSDLKEIIINLNEIK